jgi:hemolysin activation/secretion protein
VLSSGRGLDYGRAAYDALIAGAGTQAGIAYADLRYVLGDSLADLGGHGTAATASAWLRQPLVRSVALDLCGQLRYLAKSQRDELDVRQLHTDRHLGALVATLSGDARDAWGGGGVMLLSLELTAGRVGFDNAAAATRDSGTARTRGSYAKAALTTSRLQTLTPTTALYLAVVAQWSDKNLDEAEKLAIGGEYTVRGYDLGALSADTGYQLTAELRRELDSLLGARAQLAAFVDAAHATVDKDPWAAGVDSATLAGVGTGLQLAWRGGWRAKLEFAARVGALPVLVTSSDSVRAWAEVGKAF